MEWLDAAPSLDVAPATEIALLQQAIARRPDNLTLRTRLASALQRNGNLRAAATAFEWLAGREPGDADAWAGLAQCLVGLQQFEAALDVCRRAERYGAAGRTHTSRAYALQRLGHEAELRDAVLTAVATGDRPLESVKILLTALAKKEDGAELLAVCDGLAPALRQTALVLGFRAIALSRLGRVEEARRMVDLDRHVARVPFSPPAEFSGIESFNQELADNILADPAPVSPRREGLNINYSPHFQKSRSFLALRAFMRAAITEFINDAPSRGLDTVLPPPPVRGSLGGASVVLRGDGSNGEHIHASGYISVVYYVVVPESVTVAEDHRGALLLGSCRNVTGGHIACWGTRCIKPVPGTLVVFPSHIFHDVVPSQTDSPRISVAADLKPDASMPAGAML